MFALFRLVGLTPEMRELQDRRVSLEMEIEQANLKFDTLHANNKETISRLSREHEEKDLQVLRSHFEELIQISALRDTCQKSNEIINQLNESVTAIEARGRKQLEAMIEEAELRVTYR